MKVAKRFRWEAAHRLPWHTGGCQHLHGHSYELWLTLEGQEDARGLLVDFKDVKRVLAPLIDAFDHSTLVHEADGPLRDALARLGSRATVLPVDTTSENLARYVLAYLGAHAADGLETQGVSHLSVRLQETETCYAEHAASVDEARALARTLLAAAPAFQEA